MTGNWSLRTRSVLVTFLALLPILGVVSYIVYQSLQNSLDQVIDTETFVSDTIAQGLETTFDDNGTVLEQLAASDAIRALASQATGTAPLDEVASTQSGMDAARSFQDLQTYRRNITAIFLTDREGRIALWNGTPDQTDFQAQVSATVSRTSTTGATAISGALTSVADDAPFIALTVPVYGPSATSAEVSGVVGAILSVDRIRQTFTPFARGNTIIMIVADREIVATSAPDDERSSLLSAFLSANETTGEVFRYEGGGEVDRVGVSAAVEIGDSSPWSVVVSNPSPTTNGPTQTIIARGVAATSLAVLLALLISWLLASRTARRLDRLTHEVTSLSAGQLPVQPTAAVTLEGGREVRQLGAAFQEMARRLARQVEELAASNQQREDQAERLRDLNRRNIRTQEEERRRIAGDIHDAVSPLITGALYQTRALLLDTSEPDPERQREGFRDIGDLLASASDELHGVIFDLRPPDLDDLGVVAAIERYIANFNRGSMAAPSITVTGQEPTGLTSEIRVTVYRIVQEALHNVVRHSGADEAVVALETIDGQFQVMIRDNGAGFDPEKARRPTSLGLLSMRERAGAIGASLHIESTPGLGTAVILDRRMAPPNGTARRFGRRPRSTRPDAPNRGATVPSAADRRGPDGHDQGRRETAPLLPTADRQPMETAGPTTNGVSRIVARLGDDR